ncbi:hypothetical protein FB451DRAFT_1183939 [Mycena latifolia]|nr:hypothetical protein FB451DRAFT_1183939 [Mycena latifolia]
MLAHSPPHPTTLVSRRPKRVYIACVHCRKRKIKCITSRDDQPCQRCKKRGLKCDYVSVPEQQARSASSSVDCGQEVSERNPPSVFPSMSMTPTWNTPRSEGNPSHSGHSSYPPANESQFHLIPHGNAQTSHPISRPPQAQHPASRDRNHHNDLGKQNQLPCVPLVYAAADSSHRQPIVPGYSSDYLRYFASFGLNDAALDIYGIAPARQEGHATVLGPDE